MIENLPIESPQRKSSCKIGKHDEQRKLMLCSRVRITNHFDRIEENNRGGNHERLSNFESIYAGQNVDCVRTENGQHPHVNVVEEA